MRKIRNFICWLLFFSALLLTASSFFSFAHANGMRALIIYPGRENQQGYFYGEKIKTYLRHFGNEADLLPSSRYTGNLIGSYHLIFYIGDSGDPPGKSLIDDLSRTEKKVIWLNDNLDELDNWFFQERGFEPVKKSYRCKLISYKNIFLPKQDRSLNVVKITDANKNIVYGWAVLSKYGKSPYILNSGNFWYVADNPFKSAREGSSYLAFADILHSVIKDHHQDRIVMIRIDGVNPKTDPEKLQNIVDFLYFSRLPFALSITPVYKKSWDSKPVYLHNKSELTDVIKDARTKGAVLVLNGYTHQTDGETGKDYEFGPSELSIQGGAQVTEKRINLAIKEMGKSGLVPIVWQTPYYHATPEEHKVISRYFSYVFERGAEPPIPYLINTNSYGQIVIPENLGYVAYGKIPFKETIPERAWRMQVVRDAYAGFSIQVDTSIERLVRIISRMRGMSFNFASPFDVVGLKSLNLKKPFFMDYYLYSISLRTENLMQSLGWMVLPALFFTYYLVIFGLSRRIKPRGKKENGDLFFIFVVPALNEEKVIMKTLTKLVSLPQRNYLVLAINDNSDDGTEVEMKKVHSFHLKILTLTPPRCRRGKGEVLNRAYQYILQDSGVTKKYSPQNIIFSVVDSDGGVDPDIIPSVTPYFDSHESASVQSAVRIENCDRNIWTKWQDFEFRVFTFLFQSAREQLGSVGLGGNGQFIRLSALMTLGKAPWTNCLTEDLDIGIRLLLGGWRNHFCPTTYVYQQGVPRFLPLVKQRTRWFQGHLQCWRHLGRIAVNRLPVLAKVDVTYYLLSISFALFIIPANFLMGFQASYLAANPNLFRFLLIIFGSKIFFYWYFIYFGALPIFIYSYWRSKKQSLIKAILLSHLFLFISMVWLVAGYIAIFRLFRKTSDWQKTDRYSSAARTDW